MRTLLIATTALISITSLAMAGPLPARKPASSAHAPNANQEFLCNYGFRIGTSVSWTSGSSLFYVRFHRAATPIFGRGRVVSEISVLDASSSSLTNAGFSVAIYASKNNRPLYPLVRAQVGQPTKCERFTVSIPPTQLAKGTKYWIVETAAVQPLVKLGLTRNSFSWMTDKKTTHRALSQNGSCYASASGVSSYCDNQAPWKPITTGVPYARVR
jgi:hypothetical protein